MISLRNKPTLPCFECSLPISIHRVGVANHQKDIIQRTCSVVFGKEKKRKSEDYPDGGASVETES